MRNANAPEPRIRNGGTWIAAEDPPGIGLSKSLPGLKVPWSVETWTDTDSGLADGLVISTEVLRTVPASPRPDLAITSMAGLSAISSPFERVWTLAERGGTNSSAAAASAPWFTCGTRSTTAGSLSGLATTTVVLAPRLVSAAGIHQRSVGPEAQLACPPEPTAIGALKASTCT